MWGWIRGGRSLTFLLVFLAYLIVVGLLQRVVIFPLVWARPASAFRVFARWIRLQAGITLTLLRTLGGVRLRVVGHIPPQSCIVIMNHQSLIDIPIGLALMRGPLPLIAARRRYARGLPGISPYVRTAPNPLVSQKPEHRKADLAGILKTAALVDAGEASLLLFPEGHRTRDGEILPFMPGGLHTVLSRTRRPVYAIVGDGMWQSRTLKEALLRLAGLHINVRVIGPFEPPADKTDIQGFVDHIRAHMVETLNEMRRSDAA